MKKEIKKVSIGCDHAGYEYKTFLIKKLKKLGIQVIDRGTHGAESVDYPDFAHPVAKDVSSGEVGFGILICGTGNGVCMTANKHEGVRAGLCWEVEVAKLIRMHNDANVLCIPARFVSKIMAGKLLDAFVSTDFEGGRHQNRINKIFC
jgi:ribose 5-phosphate isomerase B